MKQRKVSVIVPVYNVEKFIGRCVKSIVNQRYKNIEIILVDDGSTDSSGKICDSFFNSDNRIKIIHKKNEGLSSARNTGLELTSGDYILFVDGDDWLSIDYIQVGMQKINSFDIEVDVLFTPYIREYDNKSVKNPLFSKRELFFGKKQKRELLRRFFGPYKSEMANASRIDDLSPVWGKFYKSEFCKRVKFTDTSIIGMEDVWYNINVFSQISSAFYLGGIYYHYNKENSSSIVSSYNQKLLERWKTLYKYMDFFIRENGYGKKYEKALNNRIVINLFALTRNVFNSDFSYWEKRKKIEEILNDSIYTSSFKEFEFRYLDLKWKIFYKACQYKIIEVITVMLFFAEKLKKKLK